MASTQEKEGPRLRGGVKPIPLGESFAVPARGLLDMFADTARGSVKGTLGGAGDIAEMLRAYTGGPQLLPTTENWNKWLPPVKEGAPPSPYEDIGEFFSLGGLGKKVAKGGIDLVSKAAKNLRAGNVPPSPVPGGLASQAGIFVYHGSPYKFAPVPENPLGKFNDLKIGSGEGNAAYGVGHYLGERRGTAEQYRLNLAHKARGDPAYWDDIDLPPALSTAEKTEYGELGRAIYNRSFHSAEAMKQAFARWRELREKDLVRANAMVEKMPRGHLYTVDLPDELLPGMLHWDRPLSANSPQVRDIVQSVLDTQPNVERQLAARARFVGKEPHGMDLYKGLAGQVGAIEKPGGATAASLLLRERGIPGLRYLDAGSRGRRQSPEFRSTSNFVVFDPESVRIVKREY